MIVNKSENHKEIVDSIENDVYAHLKPMGFRKHGRTIHRFVSGDISQVVGFQTALASSCLRGNLCVNIGIRIPECDERSFTINTEQKKFYHEYNCTMRSRLGKVSGNNETWFELKEENRQSIVGIILKELNEIVLPVFEVLNSREKILTCRRSYPLFDGLGSHLILLDECMIYGHLGNKEKAKELFEKYYQSCLDEYNDEVKNGWKYYLRAGETIVHMGQHITAEKDGFVTLYGAANHRHIDYLDELAKELNLRT